MFIDITLSLDTYERKLLDSFRNAFWPSKDQDTLVHNSADHLGGIIYFWHWARKVVEDSDFIIYGEDWVSNHKGEGQKVWDALVRRLESESISSYQSCHSKLSKLLDDNPRLQQTFLDTDFVVEEDVEDSHTNPTIRILPAHQDESYWDLVFDMNLVDQLGLPGLVDRSLFEDVSLLNDHLNNTSDSASPSSPHSPAALLAPDGLSNFLPKEDSSEQLQTKGKEFEIWSLVRKCSALERSTSEHLDIVGKALQECGFYAVHDRYADGFVHKKHKELDFKVKSTVFYGFRLSC